MKKYSLEIKLYRRKFATFPGGRDWKSKSTLIYRLPMHGSLYVASLL